MGGMDLDRIEAGLDGIPGGSGPGANHRPALFGRELARRQPSRRDRLAGRADGLPQLCAHLDLVRGEGTHAIHRTLRGRFAPAMRKLNPDRGVLAPHEVDERFEALGLRLVPDAEVMLVDQANLFDGLCLDKDKPKASQRIAAEMDVVKHAAGAARPGAIVHHRRHDEAVLQESGRGSLNGENSKGREGSMLFRWLGPPCDFFLLGSARCATSNNSPF